MSQLRDKYLGKALIIQKVGSLVMMGAPVFTVLARTPSALFFLAAVGVLTMLSSVLMYVAILPEELDVTLPQTMVPAPVVFT